MSNVIRKLSFIAVCGLWACGGMVYIYDVKVSTLLLSTPFCKEAMKIVRKHEGARACLGNGIKDMGACYNGSPKDIKVNVMGSITWGVLYLSLLEGENENYVVDSIQLQIGKDDSKRLVIKESSNKSDTQ